MTCVDLALTSVGIGSYRQRNPKTSKMRNTIEKEDSYKPATPEGFAWFLRHLPPMPMPTARK